VSLSRGVITALTGPYGVAPFCHRHDAGTRRISSDQLDLIDCMSVCRDLPVHFQSRQENSTIGKPLEGREAEPHGASFRWSSSGRDRNPGVVLMPSMK